MCRPGFATPVSFLSLPASNVHMGNEVMPKPQPSGLQCWHRRTTNQSKQLRISKKAEELKGIDGMISFWILETSWDFFYWMNFLWCCLFIVSLSIWKWFDYDLTHVFFRNGLEKAKYHQSKAKWLDRESRTATSTTSTTSTYQSWIHQRQGIQLHFLGEIFGTCQL